MASTHTIHLGITFDKNYVTLFYVLLTSVFDNNKANKIVVHAIASDVSKEEQNLMRQFVTGNKGEIFFYEIASTESENLSLREGKHLTAATYYRLYLTGLVPESIEKLLYLDTDIVVIGDLADLYNTNLQGRPAAAVNYPASKPRPELSVNQVGDYFNAGVILINLPVWKAQQVSEKTIQYVQQYPERCRLNDQDGLNAVLANNYRKLEKKYNITLADLPSDLPKRNYKKYLSDKVIIHYTRGGHKPWKLLGKNKFRYLYHNYLKQSPRASEKIYTDFKWHPKTLAFFIKIRTEERLYDFPLVHRSFQKLAKLGKKRIAKKPLS